MFNFVWRTALLALLLPTASLADEKAAALREDDECHVDSGDCGLNALQLKAGSENEESLLDAASGEVKPKHKIWTLYHVTGSKIGPKILRWGFRPGHLGWCGGGIYFGNTPQETKIKAVGVDSKQGYLIQAKVAVGDIVFKPRFCISDAKCVAQNPGLAGHLRCLSNKSFDEIRSELQEQGHDSIVFNPGDGNEVVIYNKSQVISMKHVRMPGQSEEDFEADEEYTQKYLSETANDTTGEELESGPVATASCTDTADWTNGFGKNCSTYASEYCENGGAKSGSHWTLGQKFNQPEANCCACGKLYHETEAKFGYHVA